MSDLLWSAVELAAVDHLASPAPVDQALALLRGITDVRAELDRLESDVVAAARHHGATWREIGDAAGGISKQAAGKKWGSPGGAAAHVGVGVGVAQQPSAV